MDMHALSFVGGCVLLAWSVLLMAGEIGGEWDRIVSALKGDGAGFDPFDILTEELEQKP